MKKIIIALFAIIAMVFTGCKTTKIPTPDKVQTIATKVGAAAGIVATNKQVSQEVVDNVMFNMHFVANVLPTKDQKFKDLWMPIVEENVAKQLAEGKINELEAASITAIFNIQSTALDFISDKKCPALKEYSELTKAVVTGFIDGFMSTFKPVNADMMKAAEPVPYDQEAYDYLISVGA